MQYRRHVVHTADMHDDADQGHGQAPECARSPRLARRLGFGIQTPWLFEPLFQALWKD